MAELITHNHVKSSARSLKGQLSKPDMQFQSFERSILCKGEAKIPLLSLIANQKGVAICFPGD